MILESTYNSYVNKPQDGLKINLFFISQMEDCMVLVNSIPVIARPGKYDKRNEFAAGNHVAFHAPSGNLLISVLDFQKNHTIDYNVVIEMDCDVVIRPDYNKTSVEVSKFDTVGWI